MLNRDFLLSPTSGNVDFFFDAGLGHLTSDERTFIKGKKSRYFKLKSEAKVAYNS